MARTAIKKRARLAEDRPAEGRLDATPERIARATEAGRARLDILRAVPTQRIGEGVGPRSGLPSSEAALHARDKLRRVEEKVGPAAWPVLARIVIEGASVPDCRRYVPELATPWRADAVIADRLLVGLDALGSVLGVTRPA